MPMELLSMARMSSVPDSCRVRYMSGHYRGTQSASCDREAGCVAHLKVAI